MELEGLRNPQRLAVRGPADSAWCWPATPAFLDLGTGKVDAARPSPGHAGRPAAHAARCPHAQAGSARPGPRTIDDRAGRPRARRRRPDDTAPADISRADRTVTEEPPGHSNRPLTRPDSPEHLVDAIRSPFAAPPGAPRDPGARLRGSPQLRLRVGFVLIAMVLSLFGARLVQLQGVDPDSYAAMAAAEGPVEVVLPAERGDILDRNGEPLADSVDGLMVVADPSMTRDQAPRAGQVPGQPPRRRLLRHARRSCATGGQPVRVHRPPGALDPGHRRRSDAAQARGFEGLDTRRDPVRDYPADDVGGQPGRLHGHRTTSPLAGFERTFDTQLAGTDGSARYEVGGGNRIPLGDNTTTKAVDGQDLHTTIDRDLQWYTQRVAAPDRRGRPRRLRARGRDGHPHRRAARPGRLPDVRRQRAAGRRRRRTSARAPCSDVYEPGSVEKVLTLSSLIDAGKVTAAHQARGARQSSTARTAPSTTGSPTARSS